MENGKVGDFFNTEDTENTEIFECYAGCFLFFNELHRFHEIFMH